ncbi:MAG: DinB family protein [Caldilineaceae bacterium]
MSVTTTEIEESLQILTATPRRIEALTKEMTEARLQAKADANSWSANDLLAHLRACADVWGKNIAVILAEDTPTIRHLSPRTWLRKTDYPSLSFHPSFAAFTAQRAALLTTLRGLTLTEWSRAAKIKDRQQERTVLDQVRQLAQHEAGHWQQLQDLCSRLP